MTIKSFIGKLAPVPADAPMLVSDEPDWGTFHAILSTPTLDRDGDILATSEWIQPLPSQITVDIDHGQKVASTVGSAVPWIAEDGNLHIKGRFASTPLAQQTRTLVTEGHITAVSVAYRENTSIPDGQPKRELMNAAIVAIPANPEAEILFAKAFTDAAKAGARHNKTDAAHVQTIHDAACSMGATCLGTASMDDGECSTDDTEAGEKSLSAVVEETESSVITEAPAEAPVETPAVEAAVETAAEAAADVEAERKAEYEQRLAYAREALAVLYAGRLAL